MITSLLVIPVQLVIAFISPYYAYIQELRELTKLGEEGCDTFFHIVEDELNAGSTEASLEELKQSRPKGRIDKLLRDTVSSSQILSNDTCNPFSKQISLRFLLNPVKFIPDPVDGTKLGSVLCEKCELQGGPFQQVAVGTGLMEELPANMVRQIRLHN